MSGRRARRSGFALTTAIVLLGLVGIATAAVTALLVADARRTTTAAEEAQLRQLLTAGALDAQARLEAGSSESTWSISLPPDVAEVASVQVSISSTPDDASLRDAQVRATFNARHLSQTVRFRPVAGGRWSAVEAQLGR